MLFVFIGCSKDDKYFIQNTTYNFKIDSFNSIDTLKGIDLKDLSDSLFLPTRILVQDSLLIVSESVSDNLFHFYNTYKNEYIGMFGLRGAGPGEGLTPWRCISINNKEFAVLDTELGKIIFYNTDTLLAKNKHSDEFIHNGLLYTNGFMINNKELIYLNTAYTPASDNTRFYSVNIYDSKTPTQLSGTLPKLNKNYPKTSEVEQQRTLDFAHLTNNEEKLFLAYHYIPLIEIIDFKSGDKHSITGPIDLPTPKYFGYASFFSSPLLTKDHLYVLYWNGNYTNLTTTKEILVFDLEGNPSKKIILDQGISLMDIQNNTLYGLITNSKDSENKVVKFNMN